MRKLILLFLLLLAACSPRGNGARPIPNGLAADADVRRLVWVALSPPHPQRDFGKAQHSGCGPCINQRLVVRAQCHVLQRCSVTVCESMPTHAVIFLAGQPATSRRRARRPGRHHRACRRPSRYLAVHVGRRTSAPTCWRPPSRSQCRRARR